MRKGRGKWIWSICYGRILIAFKSPDKYINSTKTVITNIKICFMWKSSTIIICHLVVSVGMKLPEQEVEIQPCALLNTRSITDLRNWKKTLNGKFSKPSVKNFKVWLSLLKKHFSMHRTLATCTATVQILCLLKGDDSSETGRCVTTRVVFLYWVLLLSGTELYGVGYIK